MLSTAKISELRLHNRNTTINFPLYSHPSLTVLRYRFNHLFFSTSSSNFGFTAASLRVSEGGKSSSGRTDDSKPRKYPWDDEYDEKGKNSSLESPGPRTIAPSPPWLQRWSAPTPSSEPRALTLEKNRTRNQGNGEKAGTLERPSGGNGSIERIVHRLRNLGLEKDVEGGVFGEGIEGDGDERLGDLLERSWNRPDSQNAAGYDEGGLPWERDDNVRFVIEEEVDDGKLKKRRVKAPTLAELTIEDSELRRLRTAGMTLRERMTIPKAGVTQAIVEKIHDVWRKSELVRLKFHETLAHDMRTAHEIVERRTGGLVIWRAGSVMVVYRGSAYERPLKSQHLDRESASTEGNAPFIPDISQASKTTGGNDDSSMSASDRRNEPSSLNAQSAEITEEEEAEYNRLLEGVGPRFLDWWGTGFLPVDADLLPQNIPGYRAPFRLLPTGMRSRLTNVELTSLRRMARKLPCHFALGRNRHHHGLAAAIVQLWEKSLVVKIAVKRGIQNTNNKLMADELKQLTGGILLQRNKYYIVIYRGKDFLPPSVASALAERQELTKDIAEDEERARGNVSDLYVPQSSDTEGHPAAGTLAEFREAQTRWGREISADERQKMKEEASKSIIAKFVKRIEHKLSLAQAKKLRAESLLAKIESSMVPVGPSDDQETITDEERSVFRRIGLRMKAYLPLGIRGVFDGVIENMHLHWKHRELVKLISKQKTLSFVEDTARLLEYESGGILVAIERVSKGYALIYYRGKNYRRPISIRPRNLLTKAKALKRSVAMQRHEALSQHITELERTIEQYKLQLIGSEDEGSSFEYEDEDYSHESDDDSDGQDFENTNL